MTNRTFVIGDIHGGFKALVQVLNRARVTASDRLIFLGDYVDGWSESPEVIRKLITLKSTHHCVFLRGNHDALFAEWLETHKKNELWLQHGGQSTMEAYAKLSRNETAVHRHFFADLENYYTDASNRLFLHAGFSKLSGPQYEYEDYVFYWDRTLWETALATDPDLKPKDPRYPKRFTHFDEIFIGHTPVNSLGSSMPVKALTVWNIDTGAGFRGPLSMMDIDTKEVFQSDPVYQLYPDETGRA